MIDAMATLPIRRLTLYKHGVCFVEREGRVDGEEVALTFRADEVNDALKSLLVMDRRGGQVLGIGYDTPLTEGNRPGSAIALSPDHSLVDLLRSLRGWRVRLVAGEGSAVEEHSGRLVGVDVADETAPHRRAIVTVLDEASGAVAAVALTLLRRVDLLEERAAGDLSRFLDLSRGKDEQRTATVRLSAGEHDLAVSYLVPSPTWRVSYRLVVASASDGGASTTDAELQLQGWGLFDNGLDEDLDGVQVTLVAGQPISFVYDLAASRIPRRPVVQDEARVAAQPVEFAAFQAQAQMDDVPEERARGVTFGVPTAARMARAAGVSPAELAQQQAAATGSELGELFQYEVAAPVTVRRGASALVPILNSRLSCRREFLFNEAKLPAHPVAALRFANATGLVLERGPVTVLEDGTYRGEAMLPFSREGADVYLAYLVELGIRVTVETTSRVETAGIRIEGAAMQLKQAMIRTTRYHVENGLSEPRQLTIEHAALPDSELVETPAPAARTAGLYRWSVDSPARGTTTFTVAERHLMWQSSQLFDQSYAALHEYWQRGWIDDAMLARLQALFAERAAVAKNDEEIARLGQERAEVFAREEQTRQNIAALAATGDEGALRKRAVAQLQQSEDRLDAIQARITALQEENRQRQAAIEEMLAALHAEV